MRVDARETLPFRVIGICGLARSGKDTLADAICTRYKAIRYSMADPLKRGLTEMFDLPPGIWDSPDKEKPLDWLGISPRRLAQTLGTEWGRVAVRDDLWVRLAERFIREVADGYSIIIPDIRFNNEALMVYNNGGAILQIRRPNNQKIEEHPSEKGVSPGLVDATIWNDRTPQELLSAAIRTIQDIHRMSQSQPDLKALRRSINAG